MSTNDSTFSLEQHLSQVGEEHGTCLLYLACNWSGHSQMYRNMVSEICQNMNPQVTFLYQPLNNPPFDQLKTVSKRMPTLYFLKDNQLKAVIEGILPRHQIRERIQLFNSS